MIKSRRKLLFVFFIGIILWFCPEPTGLEPMAWHLFAVFAAIILGFILQPIPIGAVAFIGVTAAALLGVMDVKSAISGYGNSTIWLIVCAFLLARAFIKSGLGKRIAFLIIKSIGKSSLTLGYAITFSDFIISPATPSSTARAGGIIFPIIKSLSSALGSEPGTTARKFGAYIMQIEYQANAITCAMFMTAMAGNPLIVELAVKTIDVHITWGIWAMAAVPSGIISLILMPYLLYKLFPPEISKMSFAKKMAADELAKMGKLSLDEKVVIIVFIGALLLWSTSGLTNMDATVVGMLTVCVLVLTGVLNWQDVLNEKGAWDTMFWMGSLIALADALTKSGFIKYLSTNVGQMILQAGISWLPAFGILILVYVYSHYAFASVSAHIGAMYAAFLAVAVAVGTPPLLAAIAFAVLSNLMIPLTHYGGGAAPILFGAGYVSQAEWWKLGFIITTVNIVIWLGFGSFWWKICGLW
ncbi:anion permease [Pectinatus cerevisiiphilus]|uniref:DASS family divalent anion:Na+ symporter n=1 Tax=Pectinatus cerevisiiphilus TaxID=86956 RepID=A0A4R3KET7_9FIRM|nr:anion permease [Pectinatus cerevisiiphilus]TCS81479.1 DASS family divalent anion:Na+ symporter [Pectinatus cerevisiiphilus]